MKSLSTLEKHEQLHKRARTHTRIMRKEAGNEEHF